MPSCVYKNCKNHDKKVNKSHGISFHTFPSNEVVIQDWITIVRKQRGEAGWMPSKSSRICSTHFKSTDKYSSNKGYALLKKSAIPVIEEGLHTTEDSNISNNNIQHFPTGMDDISIEDIEEILESPKESALRRCVNDLKLKQKLLQKRNKVLVQNNKRLKQRIVKMGVILKELKAKDFISKEEIAQILENKLKDLTYGPDCKPSTGTTGRH